MRSSSCSDEVDPLVCLMRAVGGEGLTHGSERASGEIPCPTRHLFPKSFSYLPFFLGPRADFVFTFTGVDAVFGDLLACVLSCDCDLAEMEPLAGRDVADRPLVTVLV